MGLAALAGISRQKAHRAIELAKAGKAWRGVVMTARTVAGHGGPRGLRSEVAISSLPDVLQLRWKEREARALGVRVYRDDDGANDRRSFLIHVLGPALRHPKGSAERAAAVAIIASHGHYGPDGQTHTFGVTTLRRYLRAYENQGVAGLQKAARGDRGTSRYLISKAWHQAVPFDQATKQGIAGRVTDHVRQLWRSGFVLSMVLRSGFEELSKLTVAAGYNPGYRELQRICRLTRGFVEPHKHLRKVDRYERDRKAHEDAKPRIARSLAGMLPGELVVGDVHAMNVAVRHPHDGRLAYPKMVAWVDFATRRLHASVFLPEINEATNRSRSITNAHVIASFLAMVRDWGMPANLYLDNGSEYNFADFIDDAMRLIGGGLQYIDQRRAGVVRAKPYNASAKIIEGVFHILNSTISSSLPGYVGDDRMNKKTARVGKDPVPFPKSFIDFMGTVQDTVTIYNTQPQRGQLDGRSPIDAFAAAVTSGWSRIDADPIALRVAFSEEEAREVIQGGISVAGQRWSCDALRQYLGDRVTVLIPKYEDWRLLPIKDDRGGWLGDATPESACGPLDPAGARESTRRSNLFEGAVRLAGKTTPRLDVIGEVAAMAARALPPPVAPSGGVVSLGDAHASIGRALTETPQELADRRSEEISRRQQEQLAIIERHMKRTAGNAE